MPPKKKQRQSQAGSPAPTVTAKSSSPAPEVADDAAILNDPWTDDEEIGLFKGLMRWKPTGIHKNFRLLALHAWLLENNYIHPKAEHTRPKGIWDKLNSLYDLAALDAREDARQLSPLRTTIEQEEDEDKDDDADVYSEAANKIENDDFDLSAFGEGFDEMMWKARFPDQGEDSDVELAELNLAQEPPVRFTPSFSIEPSDAATPRSRKGRTPASSKGRGGRGGAAASTRRSTRADKEEEPEEADEEGEEDEASDEDDEEEESEDEQSQASTPAPRRGRPSKGTRGKPAGRGRGRGRGRGK